MTVLLLRGPQACHAGLGKDQFIGVISGGGRETHPRSICSEKGPITGLRDRAKALRCSPFDSEAVASGGFMREQEPDFERVGDQVTSLQGHRTRSMTGDATIERYCHELAR
jgi:hypothetical protein